MKIKWPKYRTTLQRRLERHGFWNMAGSNRVSDSFIRAIEPYYPPSDTVKKLEKEQWFLDWCKAHYLAPHYVAHIIIENLKA